jgi:hypothetical protein
MWVAIEGHLIFILRQGLNNSAVRIKQVAVQDSLTPPTDANLLKTTSLGTLASEGKAT